MKLLVDTNILLRVTDPASPQDKEAADSVRHLQRQGYDLYWCTQIMIEFWVVATRPLTVNGLGLTIAQAEFELADFERTFALLTEPDDIAVRWRSLVNRYSVQGRQAHDARLVALMAEHGVTHLLTFNTDDFTRYQEITPITPGNALRL